MENSITKGWGGVIAFAVLIALTFLLGGCADAVNQLQRGTINNFAGDYHIIKYSGGKVVEEYKLRNIKVTQEAGTDGVFFIHKGVQYEVLGDLTIKRGVVIGEELIYERLDRE